jgi:hypothetical protein
MKRLLLRFAPILLSAFAMLASLPSSAAPDQKYVVKPVAEKKVKELPAGPLYWRLETFATLDDARVAVGPEGWNPAAVRYETTLSLIAEVDGKVWVATLGPPGASTPGGTKVAEIGPVPELSASEYLLRLNYGSGPAGSKTPAHSHPGSESFYVISGRLGQRTPEGVRYVDGGQTMNGHKADTTMQVFNAGEGDLKALIMFVVDAAKPFSVPAKH